MRFRTAVILSAALISSFFGLPDVIKAVFLPSLEQAAAQGTTTTPAWDWVFLEVASFLFRFRWVLALPIAATVVLLFVIAGLTTVRARHRHSCR